MNSRSLQSGLAAVTMWGLAPVATRALVVQLAPLPLLVLRLALAGVVLLPWCVPVLRRLDRASLGRLAVAGLLGWSATACRSLSGSSGHPRRLLPAAAWAELGFLTLGSTVAGMLLWNLAVAGVGSAKAGLLLFLEPLVGITGGVVLIGEHLSAGIAAGGCLIMAGVCIAWTAQRRPAGTPATPVMPATPADVPAQQTRPEPG